MNVHIFEDRENIPDITYRRPRRSSSLSSLRSKKNKFSTVARLGSSGADRRQGCIVKVNIGRGREAAKKHLKYIERDGVGKDGEKPEIFGNVLKTEMIQKTMKAQYRIIISPEQNNVSLSTLTRSVVKYIETQIGAKIAWVAAEHYNTDHPHAHLIIRDTDLSGKIIYIPPAVIKNGIRNHARDSLTVMYGERRKEPFEQRLEAGLLSFRPHVVDKHFSVLLSPQRIVTEKKLLSSGRMEPLYRRRIAYLIKKNLVSRTKKGYVFASNWTDELAAGQRYESYCEVREALQTVHPRAYSLYTAANGVVTGRVVKVGYLSEISSNNYVVIETPDKKAFFVPSYFQLRNIKQDDIIRVTGTGTGRMKLTIEHVEPSHIKRDSPGY